MSKKSVYRAGLIPFIKEGENIYMMFMKPSAPKYGGDTFQIAKGKKESGETLKETAIREANEELGLLRDNIKQVEEVGIFMGRTSVFVGHIRDKNLFGDPGCETAKVQWMTLEEFMQMGRDLHKPVVKSAYRKILKILEIN
jgi:8-oxo-dGTP pyrophosphatase MutT (NUDIX family)